MSDGLDTSINRPIEGDITSRNKSMTAQLPGSAFIEAIDSIFAFDFVESIRWRQFTPYFNDGDACEFTIYDPAVKIAGVDEEEGDWEDGYLESYGLNQRTLPYPTWPNHLSRYGQDTTSPEYVAALAEYNAAIAEWQKPENRSYIIAGHNTEELSIALGRMNWYAFEYVLENNFGDHAIVTATREGFDVEFYDHD